MVGADARRPGRLRCPALLGLPRSDRDERRAARAGAGALLDELGVDGVRRPATRAACPTPCASGSRWRGRWSASRELLLLDEPAERAVATTSMAELGEPAARR